MKKLMALGMVLVTTGLLACGGDSVEGIYYNVDNEAEFIELKNDGTYNLQASDLGFSGKYVVKDKTLVLNPQTHMTATGRIEKDLIVDSDGTRWKKRKS